MKMPDGVLFDFDGVILDSVEIKTRAFATLYRSHGQVVDDAVVAYHMSHLGISRYEKFRTFHRELLGTSLNETELIELGKLFEELVLHEVIAAPFIPGALDTLEQLKSQDIPAFVVSGTPEEEMRQIVTARNLDAFFTEVHGSPRKKPLIIQDIAERRHLDLASCLFIGDAMTDHAAALETGVPFLGIVPEGLASPFPLGTRISTAVAIPVSTC